MTRWARGQAKREHDASSWDDLKISNKGNAVRENKKEWNKQKRIDKNGKNNKAVPEWLEKRRAARRLRRKKGKPCFHCRQSGHVVSECPTKGDETDVSDICFKCGSSQHMAHECKVAVKEGEYPFAKCFICKENGHLSRNCPDNPRGLYPDGGGCKFCGSVEHYRRDCPERNGNKEKDPISKKRKYKVREENDSIDGIVPSDEELDEREESNVKKKTKVVKF